MGHSLSTILIHVIFSTKKRHPLIRPEIVQDLYSYIAGIAKTNQSQLYEIGGIEDHVHLLVSLPRTLPLSKLIEEIKRDRLNGLRAKARNTLISPGKMVMVRFR